MSEIQRPRLEYRLREPGRGIAGDGPLLHEVYEVSARLGRASMEVWANGPMLRKDGQPGPSRGVRVDLLALQPWWLERIIRDASRRLSEPIEVTTDGAALIAAERRRQVEVEGYTEDGGS